jgi:hypothetical protein
MSPSTENYATNASTAKIFCSMKEASVIEQWRKHYNTIKLYSSLSYRPPARQASVPRRRHLDRGINAIASVQPGPKYSSGQV